MRDKRWNHIRSPSWSWALLLVPPLFAFAWLVTFPADASVTSDDGAYALEVLALEDGGWSVPHVLVSVDPEGVTYPYQNSSITDDGYFPGGRHAPWARALNVGHSVAGLAGMRAIPVLGLVAAVASSMSMAARIDGGNARWLAGALALASPLLFNALQLWAHTVAAGAVGVSMLGALRLMSEPRQRMVAFVLLSSVSGAVAAAVRGEGLIFAVSIGGVVALSGLRSRHAQIVIAGVTIAATAVVGYLLASLYAISIVGRSASGVAQSRSGGGIGGSVRGFVRTFIGDPSATGPFVLVIVAASLVLVGSLALRREDRSSAAMLVGLGAFVWLVRMLAFPDAMAAGLIGAWPIVLVALSLRWEKLGPSERRILGMVAVASVGVALTQYEQGGGLNWGGRFLASAIPGLAVIAAGFVQRITGSVRSRQLTRSLAALVLVTTVASLVFDATNRIRHDRHVEKVASLTSVPVVTGSPALPRLAWRTYPEVQWLAVPDDEGGEPGAERLVDLLQEAGTDRVALFFVSPEDAEIIAGTEVPDRVRSEPIVVDVSVDGG